MERLTEHLNGGGILKNKTLEGQCIAIGKLAEYEDAEEQGLLVKIECRCKDCVHWSDSVAGATEHVKLCTVGGYMVGENGYCVYAEQALKQMGE